MAKKQTAEIEQNVAYTKEQILSSRKYENRRDILGVLLRNDENYTFEKVDSLLDKFMKGKVN
ncbi:MAG: hypothetical protein IJZ16_01240 [Clostridia bacterium]|nr:hypothetical protein [Clostridia bacterium]